MNTTDLLCYIENRNVLYIDINIRRYPDLSHVCKTSILPAITYVAIETKFLCI